MKKTVICIILALLIVICTVAASFLARHDRETKTKSKLISYLEENMTVYLDNGLLLAISEDGESYVVSGIGTCTDEHVVIPEEYNGKPITRINKNVFSKFNELKTLSIPSSVTGVGSGFPLGLKFNVYGDVRYLGNEKNPYLVAVGAEAQRIFELSFHPDTRVIADEAFASRQLLESVALPSKLEYIGASAFSGCSTISGIKFPRSLKVIGDGAFMGCRSITSIDLPEGLSAIKPSAFGACGKLKSVTIPDSISVIEPGVFGRCIELTTIKFGKNVEKIEKEAFRGCTSLLSLTVPDSVTSIDRLAFAECHNLMNVILPEGIVYLHKEAFSKCESLNYNRHGTASYLGTAKHPYYYLMDFADNSPNAELELHPNTEAIAYELFADLHTYSIKTDSQSKYYYVVNNCLIDRRDNTLVYGTDPSVIPDGVKKIGDYAFFQCSSKELVILDSVVSIGDYSFTRCYELVSADLGNVTEIGQYAFGGCEKLQTVRHGNKIETIGDFAFTDCDSLASFDFPESLKSIGENSFTFSGLEEIHIPASVEEIPKHAFRECFSLRKVTLDGVKYIGYMAFLRCENLTEIKLPDTLLVIGENAFGNCGMSEITLPQNLLCIGNSAFSLTENLTAIAFPQSLIYIGEEAFSSNVLRKVTVPDSIDALTRQVFYRSFSLEEITLPASLEKIGKNALSSCPELKYINFKGTKAAWENIEKHELWRASTPALTVTCSDGSISLPENTDNIPDKNYIPIFP